MNKTSPGKGVDKGWKFFDVLRFIDDLIAISDTEIFKSNYRDIYLEELELHR